MLPLALAAVPAFTYAPPPPPANLAPNPNFYQTCFTHGNTSLACTQAVTEALDYARLTEGLGPLLLPNTWTALTPAEQIFVLTNLERVARQESPIPGMTAVLNAAALVGAEKEVDPLGPNGTWASNWAGELSPLASDYIWMYDDGWGGSRAQTSNIDCTSATAPGCWGHRNNILAEWHRVFMDSDPFLNQLAMGAAQVSEGTYVSDTLIAGAFHASSVSYTYTWAQAQQAGAGTPGGWNPVTESSPVLPPAVSVAPSNVQVGQAVTLTVPAVAGTTYQVWGQSPRTGLWRVLVPFQAGPTLTFTPTSPGDWTLAVFAHRGGTGLPTVLTVSVAPHPVVTGLTVSGVPAGVVPAGTTVTLAASATSTAGGTPLYQFWVRGTHAQWHLAQGYSSTNTLMLSNLSAGSYAVAVYALDPEQVAAGHWDHAAAQTAIVNVGSAVTLTAPSSGTVQQALPVTAQATGLTDPVYQLWWELPTGVWESSGAYSAVHTWTLLPADVGTYHVVVYAKDPLAPNTAAEAVSAEATITVPPHILPA